MLSSNISISVFLVITLLGFFTGFVGLVWKASNLLLAVVFGELMLVSLVFGFFIVSKFYGVFEGYTYPLFILNAAAAESATSLVVILNLFQTRSTIDFNNICHLRG